MAFAGFCGQVSISANGADYVVIGEVRDSTLTLNQADIDATSYNCAGWMNNIPGLKSWEMSVDALYVGDQDLGQLTGFESLLAGEIMFFRFLPKQGQRKKGYEGRGFLTSFEVNVPVDDAVSLSMSIIGGGSLVMYEVA